MTIKVSNVFSDTVTGLRALATERYAGKESVWAFLGITTAFGMGIMGTAAGFETNATVANAFVQAGAGILVFSVVSSSLLSAHQRRLSL